MQVSDSSRTPSARVGSAHAAREGRAGAPHADLHARRRHGGDVARRRVAGLEARPADRRLRYRRRAQLGARRRARGRAATTTSVRRSSASRTSSSTSAPTSPCRAGSRGGCASSRRSVDRLEEDCDHFNDALPELKSFVLPGGTQAAAALHVARTICRRAERETLAPPRARRSARSSPSYLNRLSDLLFILARAANTLAGRDEPLWKPGATR